MRICKKCNIEKDMSCFGKFTNKGVQGKRHVCISCRQETNTLRTAERRNNDVDFYNKINQNNKNYRKSENYKLHLANKRNKSKNDYANDLNFRFKRILSSAESRVRNKNLEFNINSDLLNVLAMLQNYKCAVTGIQFDLSYRNEYFKNPRAPSIDRINNSKGYTADNIQLVCAWYNLMKNEWSDDEIKTLIFQSFSKMFNQE